MAVARRLGVVLVVALAAVGIGSLACAARSRPLGDPERFGEHECLATFTLEREESPLHELRELGGWRTDVQDRFPAAVIDPSRQRPVSAAATLRLDGQPIAWWSPALDAVVLDGAAFAPLRHADATILHEGTKDRPRQVVGRVMPRAREALGERGVLELLLRVEAIQTYWHLGAELCLGAEHEERGRYRAELWGVHHVMDGRRREARVAFGVEIDAEGEIAVVGPGAPP